MEILATLMNMEAMIMIPIKHIYMNHTLLFSIGNYTSAEQRLCLVERGSETSTVRNLQDGFTGAITNQAKILFDQNKRHSESVKNMADIRLWTQAFKKNPKFLDPTVESDKSKLGDIFKPEDVLKRLDGNSRINEWKNFVEKTFGTDAMNVPVNYTLGGVTTNGPIKDAILSAEGKVILLNSLELLTGNTSEKIDPSSTDPSVQIAKKSMEYRYPDPLKGQIFAKFSEFVDEQVKTRTVGPDDPIISTPDLLLTALPTGELRGAVLLGHLNREVLQNMLKKYHEESLAKKMAEETAHKDLVELRKNVDRNAILDNGSTLLDNFNSMHPVAKLGLGLGMAYLIKKAFDSKNPLLKALPIGALGIFAYLRLIKGDTNALDTMGNSVQNLVNFSGNSLKDFGTKIGVMRPSDPKVDQFSEAVKFLDKKALLSIENGAAAFTSIAQADLAILSDHFTMPKTLDDIPGILNVDDKNSNLVKHLKIQLQKDGLSVTDQNKTIDYIISHQVETSEALFNTWFYLGSLEAKNAQKSAQLENKARAYGANGFRKLNGQDRVDYMQIAYDGHRLAKERYKGMSLLSAMQTINEAERQTTAQRWLDNGVGGAVAGAGASARPLGGGTPEGTGATPSGGGTPEGAGGTPAGGGTPEGTGGTTGKGGTPEGVGGSPATGGTRPEGTGATPKRPVTP